ncbi:uncharacterized protein LOC123508588 isoform X2 [Portunus trituberculatus]|uniref:uncharacterized protein LOC123508588 isoform X2 n=1 Tax=Portunus trituberculatus TaxID=210409 RepID=UPI001E1D1318|nr:uncharacterized protein LOC123508588 isoform X2 [Portunus trituberculatus]
MHTPKSLLVAVCLVCLTPVLVSADGDTDGEVMKAEARYVTNDEKDGLGVFIGQLLTHWMLILEAFYLITVIFAPAFARRRRSLSWDLPAAPDGTEMGLLERALNSIDPVEATFSMLQVNDMSCRQRVICEVQRSASAVPIIGSFLQQLSTSIPGLHHYREAQYAGAALEDCALLFAGCPEDALVEN